MKKEKYNEKLRNKALSTSTLDEYMKIIAEIRGSKGLLTTDKTFSLVGVHQFLGKRDIIDPYFEKINERMESGKKLLIEIFNNSIQRDNFFDFAISYQYAYTHSNRLVELTNRLISIIKQKDDFIAKREITLIDIGTAPQKKGSPTAEKTQAMFKKSFPDKKIKLTAVDIQFPPNYVFDKEGIYLDKKTGIIYSNHNIQYSSLDPVDIVIAVNLLDLYKNLKEREKIRKNIFDSSSLYVVTGIESHMNIYRKSPNAWNKEDIVFLKESWYIQTVYKNFGFSTENVKPQDLRLRTDKSINYEYLLPLYNLLKDVSGSRYYNIFRCIILIFLRDDLKDFLESSDDDKKIYNYVYIYFNKEDDYSFVEQFIIFVRNYMNERMFLKNTICTDSVSIIPLLYELVNLFILHRYKYDNITSSEDNLKILLIQPRVEPFGHIPGYLPIGLLMLVACGLDGQYQAHLFSRLKVFPDIFDKYLRTAIKFKVIDFQNESQEFNFEQYLSEYKPHIVGFRTISASIKEAERLACETRKILKNEVKILFGGYHLTSLPYETMKKNKGIVDIGFLKEAEETFPQFLAMFVANKNIATVPGLCYFNTEGKFINTGHIKLEMNLDDHPSFVQYLDIVPHRDRYYTYKQNNIHGLITSRAALFVSERGCIGKCTFCPTRVLFWTSKIRYFSASRIIKDMEYYYLYGYRFFAFRDDNFTGSEGRVYEICNEIIKRNWKIAWTCMSRSDTIDRKLLEKMRDSGMSEIGFGIESGDEEILKLMKKKSRLFSVREANLICRELNINFINYYMIGHIGERWKNIFKTMLFIIDSLVGIKFIDNYLNSLSTPTADEYNNIFNNISDKLLNGHYDLETFIKKNLQLPETVQGRINISYCTPYPGSDLYRSIGKEIWLTTDVFRHGPPERANLNDWKSPIYTKEMPVEELTEARKMTVELYRSLKLKDTETIFTILANTIDRSSKQCLGTHE